MHILLSQFGGIASETTKRMIGSWSNYCIIFEIQP